MYLPIHHLRIHHWVVWWFYVGLVCGLVAMVNIFTRDLTRSQDHLILLVGIIFWVLGGVVSWAAGGIEHDEPPRSIVGKSGHSTPATHH
jgi:hypothetical protein